MARGGNARFRLLFCRHGRVEAILGKRLAVPQVNNTC
jgi:hypothetical protein